MLVSIITPSYCSSPWLRLCIASVADQRQQLEHIVQDAGSNDGTLDWLKQDARVRLFVEPDQGMYDAINRGLSRAQGDILAWLNCDEQYLEGALSEVTAFFGQHPDVDIVFGDVVLVDADGDYICHRKAQPPLKYHTWTCHLSTLSCAIFFRRRVFFDYGYRFDPQWRFSGDAEWMLRLLRDGRVRMASLKRFTSAFTQTGSNMSASANARYENLQLYRSAPGWARQLKPLIVLHHRLRRLMHGSYFQRQFDYSIYTQASPHARVRIEVTRPTVRSRLERGVPPPSSAHAGTL